MEVLVTERKNSDDRTEEGTSRKYPAIIALYMLAVGLMFIFSDTLIMS